MKPIFFEDGLDEELGKCHSYGRNVHDAFMRKMAVRQYRQSELTNQLLKELLAQHYEGTTGGSY